MTKKTTDENPQLERNRPRLDVLYSETLTLYRYYSDQSTETH